MVRAGVVKHPSNWKHSGYNEIQSPPQRKAIIDLPQLMRLCHFTELTEFQAAHRTWIDETIRQDQLKRNPIWSESIAVGSQEFISNTQKQMGVLANGRNKETDGESFYLKEDSPFYYHFNPKITRLRPKNTIIWDEIFTDSTS